MSEQRPGRRPLRLHRPSTFGGVAYTVLLVVAIAGLGFSVLDWRHGLMVVGGALLLGALLRAGLGEYDAGMLRVRQRWFDVLAMTGVGFLLILLAATIPNQPGT